MKRGRDVTDQIERILFAQAELSYMSGATALVQQEIALTQQSMYHKPAYSRNWSWDYQAEARIRGGKAVKQYDWDEYVEARHYADADEDEPIELRDGGGITVLTAMPTDEEPNKALVDLMAMHRRVTATTRKVLTHVK